MVGQRKTIEEHKVVLQGAPKIFQCELLKRAPGQAVVIYRLHQNIRISDVEIPGGTVSYGYFWEDRNFNVYHFVDAQRRTVALYFNVSDSTRVTDSKIYWRDLVVDILVTPDGKCQVLDEDELPADLSEELLQLIFKTRDQIVEQLDKWVNQIEERTGALILMGAATG